MNNSNNMDNFNNMNNSKQSDNKQSDPNQLGQNNDDDNFIANIEIISNQIDFNTICMAVVNHNTKIAK